ncbi:hypothetical protein V8E36_007329 [Tilletia maclaganii]
MDPDNRGAAPFQTPRRPQASADAFKTPLRTPLEQTSKTPIIDMALAIESQKENVIPRAKGRSASALHNALTLPQRERAEKLSKERAEHEARIHSDENRESDDPLEAWDAYVRWTINAYPAGQTAESGLVPLLELATRSFFSQGAAYMQDVRYLRFWVLYANNCDDRRQIFKFLMANEVGTNWATLYEELANVLEANGLYDEADETYKLGIHRRAHPPDRLNRRYTEYQQRILHRPEASGLAEGGASSSSAADRNTYTAALKAAMAASKRTMLGTKVDGKAGGPSLSANSMRGAGGLASAGLASTTPIALGVASSNVKKLAVFRDDDLDEEGGRQSASNKKDGHAAGTEWNSLGSKVQRQQENRTSAKAWAGEKLGGGSGGTGRTPGKPGAAPIAVFRDSDEEAEEKDEGSSKPGAKSESGAQRTPRAGLGSGRVALAPALSETDRLRQNPFLRWDPAVLSGAARQNAPRALPSDPRQPAVSMPATTKLQAEETKRSKKSKSHASTSASSSGSGAAADVGQRQHKSSSSRSKSTSSSSKKHGVSASSSSSSSLARPSGVKKEHHAFPILLLYPHLSTLEEVVTSFEGGETRWNEPSGEASIEEILCMKRGIPGTAVNDDLDPWAYLDGRVGLVWPVKEAQRPMDVIMEEARPTQSAAKPAPASELAVKVPSQPAVAPALPSEAVQQQPTSGSSSSSSSQDRTGSQKRKRETEGDTGVSLKLKSKPREVTQTVTMFTKAAELDVRGMFNGDDSEDSDGDDDEEESEEEEEEVERRSHIPPLTPGSARHVSGPGAIPATPASQRAPVDENGDPLLMSGRRMPSVSRSGAGGGVLAPRVLSDPLAALGTVSATPIRAPLLARVPFEKVSIPGANADMGSSKSMLPPPPVPVAAGPSRAPAQATGAARVPQRMEVFREEDEEEDEGQDHDEERENPSAIRSAGEQDENENDHPDDTPEGADGDALLANATHIYHALTPITEATEFTRFTARTARTPGTASRPCRTDQSRDLLGQWNHSRRVGASARGSLARDDEDSSSSDDGEDEDSQIPRLLVLTDAQRQQMAKDPSILDNNFGGSGALSATHTVSGSLGDLGPSIKVPRENVFGPNSVSEEASTSKLDFADRSDVSSHGFSGGQVDRPLEPTGHWDQPRREAPVELDGVLIENADDDAKAPERVVPVHQDFGWSLVISDNREGADQVMAEAERDGETFVIPNPCPPVDSRIISHILGKLEHSIEDLPHFVDLRSQSAGGMLDTLQSAVRAATRKSLGGASIAKNGQVKIQIELDIAGAPFRVLRKLGEGGYGAVFLADDAHSFAPSLRPQLCMVEPEDSMDIDDEDAQRKVAIKIESPPNAWEFYVLHQLEMRLPPYVLPSLISARKLIAYEDESFLLLHYGDKGTLLDVINDAAGAGVASSGIGAGGAGGGGLDEVLAMFFTIELIQIVEQMHHCRFVHGDIKIDNCLLRLDEVLDESEWTPQYSASGTGCWAAKGMILIDFGRAIDLSCYPDGQTFIADWDADERDCLQMREGKPWVYEVDYFGIAAVAHCLLFGKYIETKTVADDKEGSNAGARLALVQPLRRYWQGELWGKLFHLLLNPAAATGKAPYEPVIEELAEVRGEMETWLEANSNRAGKVSRTSCLDWHYT